MIKVKVSRNISKLINPGKIISLLFLSVIFFAAGCQKSEQSTSETANPKSNPADSSVQQGEQIVAEYLRADAAPFRKSRLRFTITSESDPVQVYEIDLWRKQTENQTLTLSHIIKPTEDNELSSLADESKDKETVITTYSLSLNQFRETGANKALFGGVPTEELLGEWSKYNYRFTGEKDLNGVQVSEVEGKLNLLKRSIVARIIADFRKDNHLPAELHLFDSSGKELRVFRIKNYQTADGRAYISGTEIENPIYKTRVAVDVLTISFPAQIEDSIFTREQLKKIAGK